jgi:acyl-CoA reductase-like NAD-dependent aldehyde dehydrogenase
MMTDLSPSIQHARSAQRQWATCSMGERSAVLHKASKIVEQHRSEMAETISGEMGKGREESLADCDASQQILTFFAANAPAHLAPEPVEHEGETADTRSTWLHFVPLGVIGAIKPWNFPLDTPLWTIAPALMAGNAVLFKPSPLTPATARWIERIFTEAGLPDGLLHVLPSDDDTGRALVAADVDMISFTGSTKVGKEIARRCGEKMIPCLLEMGGKDAAIVLPDCDLQQAASLIALHGTMNNGQCCTSIERVFVHADIADAFVQLLIAEVRKISTVRFASRQQFDVVRTHLADAIARGCTVGTGGTVVDEAQWMIEPAVLLCDTTEGLLWQEETFGPILPVVRFTSEEEVIALANQTVYGLGASVWTADGATFQRIASQLQAGMVWQNEANTPYLEGIWAGWKESGYGSALGKYGIRAFTRMKQISAVR